MPSASSPPPSPGKSGVDAEESRARLRRKGKSQKAKGKNGGVTGWAGSPAGQVGDLPHALKGGSQNLLQGERDPVWAEKGAVRVGLTQVH
jgi:hypothetical protein